MAYGLSNGKFALEIDAFFPIDHHQEMVYGKSNGHVTLRDQGRDPNIHWARCLEIGWIQIQTLIMKWHLRYQIGLAFVNMAIGVDNTCLAQPTSVENTSSVQYCITDNFRPPLSLSLFNNAYL